MTRICAKSQQHLMIMGGFRTKVTKQSKSSVRCIDDIC